jgi:hypothetical protein
MIGGMALFFIVLILGGTRNWYRLLAGVVGSVSGYVILGTGFAYALAEGAIARHACPDAGWLGPSFGEVLGALAAVILFEFVRAFRRPSGTDKGTPNGITAG